MYLLAASQVESATAAAEPTLSKAVATIGGVIVLSLTTILLIEFIWFLLQVIADWKIFSKANVAGWKSIIPILNTFEEYKLCWGGIYGLLFLATSFIFSFMSTGEGDPAWKAILAGACGIIAVVLHFIQSIKLAKAFGHGAGFGFVLFILGPIGRIILGLGGSNYVGIPD